MYQHYSAYLRACDLVRRQMLILPMPMFSFAESMCMQILGLSSSCCLSDGVGAPQG